MSNGTTVISRKHARDEQDDQHLTAELRQLHVSSPTKKARTDGHDTAKPTEIKPEEKHAAAATGDKEDLVDQLQKLCLSLSELSVRASGIVHAVETKSTASPSIRSALRDVEAIRRHLVTMSETSHGEDDHITSLGATLREIVVQLPANMLKRQCDLCPYIS